MNEFAYSRRSASTSAGGSMIAFVRQPLLSSLIMTGTSLSGTNAAAAESMDFLSRTIEWTTAGSTIVNETEDTEQTGDGSAIAELRLRSGLNWDQLARLFGVTRRSLHFWASGKAMNADNRERLQRLIATFRQVDRGSVEENRAALLDPREDGEILFDSLAAGNYERVIALLGTCESQYGMTTKSSTEVTAGHLPPPPEELVDALQDRIQPASGRLLESKPVTIQRRS